MLTLYEELFTLTLNEEKGNPYPFNRKDLAHPLAGAILAELAFLGKLCITEKLRLVPCDTTVTGDRILDGALEQILAGEKARKASYWVSRLGEEPKKLWQSAGDDLVEKNVLVQEEKRFFRQAPSAEGAPVVLDKFQMKHRLRNSILVTGESDTRSLALLKILLAGDLLGLVFTLDEIETAKMAIHKLFLTAAMEDPILEVVDEIAQAVSAVREDEME
jgi:golgi phosphoprotein 3